MNAAANQPMADIIELRSAAERLRHWADEIRRENTPAPYVGADEDVRTLERIAGLLNEAAEEIHRLRASLKGD
jgi:molybdenum cofactor biosynthesis enzyme MoaA